ncbi:hypothetical protein ACH5RR_032719 [Cinchona calisaya]|uniref:Cysteine proteinase inhibitor n=1 Tax=Cinchona calisaya TaxID=153742 RepID=A0ABD2YM14_9GENT
MAFRFGGTLKIPTVYIKKSLSFATLKKPYWSPLPSSYWNFHRFSSSMPNNNFSVGNSIKARDDDSSKSALIGGSGTSIYKGAQKDEWIICLAKFAVNQHNQNQFIRVVGASHTAPSSLLYHITLEAKEARRQKIYHTVVWLQLWKNFMDLLTWKPVHDALSVVGVKRGDVKLHEAVMLYMNQVKKGRPMI